MTSIEWWDDKRRAEFVVVIDGREARICRRDAIERGRSAYPISAPFLSLAEAYTLGIKEWLRDIFAPDDPPARLTNSIQEDP